MQQAVQTHKDECAELDKLERGEWTIHTLLSNEQEVRDKMWRLGKGKGHRVA